MKQIGYLILILIIFIFLANTGISQTNSLDDAKSKRRLPEIINSYQPTIVPVSDIDDKILYFDRKIHPQNMNGIYDNDDIWYSEKNELGWSEPKNIGPVLNTKDSDVLFSLTPDGQFALVYGIYNSDVKKESGFSISRKINGGFNKPIPLRIKNFYNNSKNFYGFLSADRRVLLMSLSRNDSYGELDLYVSFFDEKNKLFSEPQNLGPIINTKGSEASVHLAFDGRTLYFSSNGHNGSGKLDIFMARRLDDNWRIWTEPVNLGNIINTEADDGNIWLSAFGNSAYLVSYDTIVKREGIYFAELPENMRPMPYAIVGGKIFMSSKNQSSIANESIPIALHYEDSQNIDTVWSEPSTGTYRFTLRKGILGTAIVEYGDYSASFSVATYNLEAPRWFDYDIILRKYEKEVTEIDLNIKSSTDKSLEKDKPLLTLYFDLDSDLLTQESKDKIVDFFKNNTKKFRRLKIVGHTDELGSEDYNIKLSKKRAENTAKFIKSSKLTKAKIKIIAMGKKHPISENHELNRRVEIFQIK